MGRRAGRVAWCLGLMALVLVGLLGAAPALAGSSPRGADAPRRVGSAGAPLAQLISPTPTATVSPTLAVSKTHSPNSVAVGANLTYTVTITNAGGGQLAGVTATDPLPAGVSFVSATLSQGSCPTLPPPGGTGTVSCELGSVSSSATLTLVVQPTAAVAGTQLTNTATVTTNNAGNGAGTTITQVLGPTATATATATATPTATRTASVTATQTRTPTTTSAPTATPPPAACFGVPFPFPVDTGPASVATADVNGDGRPDLLVANSGSATVSVLLNTTPPGAATPTFAAAENFAAGQGPQAVAAADVNGDGRPDLLIANAQGAAVRLNTTAPGATTPSFAAVQQFAAGQGPNSVAAADVNGDGRPDLAVANSVSNTVSVLLNTTASGATTPSFAQAAPFPVGAFARSVVAADVNGDGRPDLAVANSGANSVAVLLNTTAPGAATPSFAPAADFQAGLNPNALATADVNGDGRPDLLVANTGFNTVSVLLNTTASGAPTPSFAQAAPFPVGSSPQAVATADANLDGRPDLLVANQGSSNVSVLLNTTAQGATTPGFAAAQNFAAGQSPQAVATADVNGDGRSDLLVANASDPGSVSVLLNCSGAATATVTPTTPGTPTRTPTPTITPTATATPRTVACFAPAANFGAGSNPISVALADVNGDGRPDLLVANFNDNTASVLLNTTAERADTPSFAAAVNFPVGSGPFFVAAADVNGDGRPDLAVANVRSATVSVLLNTTASGAPTPSFAPAANFGTGTGPGSVAAADVNGDGRPDLLTANANSNTVSVLLNTTAQGAPTPSFAPAASFAAGQNPQAVATADVNGDGRPDLLVANEGSATVSVLLNTTAPGATTSSFSPAANFGVDVVPSSVAAADVNLDGRPDLLVGYFGDTPVSVLLNTTPPGATIPSFAPAQGFGAGGSPESVAAADVNGDGRPDLLTANFGSNTVSVLLNRTAAGATTPSFAPAANFGVGNQPQSVAAADVNRDGRPDLLVANGNSNNVSVLLNCPEELTLLPPQTATPAVAPTRTVTATPAPLSRTEAIEHVRQVHGRTGQPGVHAASRAGETATVQGAVTGTGRVTAGMAWTLTAPVPAGVAPGTIAHAVLSTHVDLEAFPCTPVVAGTPTVTCTGTTGGNALQGSRVVVVFALGVTALGTVTGPGAATSAPTAAVATPQAGAATLLLLPPLLLGAPPLPPPPLLPPPPPFLLPPPPPTRPSSAAAAYPEVPVIPEGDSLLLLAGGLGALGALARWRGRRR